MGPEPTIPPPPSQPDPVWAPSGHPAGLGGWAPRPARGRRPGGTPLVVGAGIVVLVLAVVAVVGVRASGGRSTASPAFTAPSVPGAGGGAGNENGLLGGGGSGGGTPGEENGALGTGSLRLPDQVGGLPRVRLEDFLPLAEERGVFDTYTQSGALDGWGLAAYGPAPSDPQFVLLVLEASQASTAGVITDGLTAAVGNRYGAGLTEPRTFIRDGVRYACYDGSLGSFCAFQDGPMVGLGLGHRDTDVERLSRLTDEARRGIRG